MSGPEIMTAASERSVPPPTLIGVLRQWSRQRWIPFGVRDRLLRLFADPDRMPSVPFECDYASLRYQGDLSGYIDWMVYFYGVYEPGVLAFLRDVATVAGSGAVFVDVGANVGTHTLGLARRVSRLHAFEPWPTAFSALRRNVEINALDNVVLHPYGLGDANAQLTFHVPITANRGTGGFVPNVNANRPGETLPVRRGDEVFADVVERVDLVKIDTEGYELKALAGMRASLASFRPVVVVEVSPATLTERVGKLSPSIALTESLGEGWQIFRLSGAERYRLEPFRYAEGEIATAVLVPEDKLIRLPRAGCWSDV
ncbi:MAG: FkbM family methyltransferase [Rhodospirillales bacterium]|nr:FkbM family methyltransferase [Rhodospirillales bacterium]